MAQTIAFRVEITERCARRRTAERRGRIERVPAGHRARGCSCCRRSSSSSAIRSIRSSASSGSASPTIEFLSNEPANWVGLRQLHRGAQRPADVGEPVARGAVHDHVPAGNDHPAAAPRDPRRPGDQSAAGDLLPRGAAHSGGDSEHARLRAVEVDVQLPGRADKPLPGRHARPVHRCRTRRNGWAERR